MSHVSFANRRRLIYSLMAGLLLTALIADCAPAGAGQPQTIRFTALPILDALPVFVAQREGIFERYNLTVEFIPAGSAPERDQLIAAGQADVMLNELLSAMFFNKDGAQVQVVRYARTASSGSPEFVLLAHPDSGVNSPADLSGKSIGISEGTIIAYVTERMLQAEGVIPSSVELISVPKIDARLALLNSGELDAAVLPEPLASAAVLQGSLPVLADSAHAWYSFSTLTVRKAVLDANPEAVRAFLRAWEDAVELINQDPDRWKQTLADQNILPPALMDSFSVPQFVTAGVPTREQYADQLAWALEKGYLNAEIPYEDCVTDGYIP